MKTEFLIMIPRARKPLLLSDEDIVHLLRMRRKSIAWLAKKIGEKRPITSMVLHGDRPSPFIRKKIHDAIAELLSEIPSRERRAFVKAA
jgi:hypothetical protein